MLRFERATFGDDAIRTPKLSSCFRSRTSTTTSAPPWHAKQSTERGQRSIACQLRDASINIARKSRTRTTSTGRMQAPLKLYGGLVNQRCVYLASIHLMYCSTLSTQILTRLCLESPALRQRSIIHPADNQKAARLLALSAAIVDSRINVETRRRKYPEGKKICCDVKWDVPHLDWYATLYSLYKSNRSYSRQISVIMPAITT